MNEAQKLFRVDNSVGGAKVIRLQKKNILDELEISNIGRQLSELIDGGSNRLIIDFSNVEHLSSSALGMLITIREKLRGFKGDMGLCKIRPEILQVFKITSLDQLFRIFPTEEEAVKKFI